jgi:hypothetical protein
MQVARDRLQSFVRALCQLTQHAYDDEMADACLEQVPQNVGLEYLSHMLSAVDGEHLEDYLRGLDLPMLFVEHHGCIGWTRESYQDAVAAFPSASTASVQIKPSCDPEFARILKEFCEGLPEPADAPTAERTS